MHDGGMQPRTRVVLGGGGALGAFQVGSLLALLEAGQVPDTIHGSSVGSLNAVYLAGRPDHDRLLDLAALWTGVPVADLLRPSWLARARGACGALRRDGALLDARPLRRLVDRHVSVRRLAELAVPVTITTTCLDCGAARHHDTGDIGDLVAASCALPGLFRPVRLADGHLHVDGGILDGVPIGAALASAGPDDRVLVLDCGLAPVTGRVDVCAAVSDVLTGQACGVPVAPDAQPYVPPVEAAPGALGSVLRAFTAARSAANRSAVRDALDDPRVHVLPHVADAWAAGILADLPAGPRDARLSYELLEAGRAVTERWLVGHPLSSSTAEER